MVISNLNGTTSILVAFFALLFFACESKERAQKRYERVEKECSEQNSIKALEIDFIGYSHNEISEIRAEIRGTQKKKFNFSVPDEILDSVRRLRSYTIRKEINIRDTVILVFPNKEHFVLSDFKYKVRPYFTMVSKNWGCDFYEMKINNRAEEGGRATFIKKGFEFK